MGNNEGEEDTFRCGKIGKSGQSGQRSSRVELTRIFQTSFFFFEIDSICLLFMSSLTVIKFSLVIMLPITTKHLIPKFGATLVPVF